MIKNTHIRGTRVEREVEIYATSLVNKTKRMKCIEKFVKTCSVSR
jgi:hypothetical protein